MDKIFIKDLVFMGRHGVGARERSQPQRFGVDITIEQEPADWKDNIRNTYNYVKARDIARRYIEEESYKLIETLAENIGKEILAHRLVKSVSVTIRKLDIFADGEGGVTITRNR
jgi:7,8-dihydroneopterin aldolase/epimerase/oxygenase